MYSESDILTTGHKVEIINRLIECAKVRVEQTQGNYFSIADYVATNYCKIIKLIDGANKE